MRYTVSSQSEFGSFLLKELPELSINNDDLLYIHRTDAPWGLARLSSKSALVGDAKYVI
jgi:hypothetical protein